MFFTHLFRHSNHVFIIKVVRKGWSRMHAIEVPSLILKSTVDVLCFLHMCKCISLNIAYNRICFQDVGRYFRTVKVYV
jgi:hypothetical protein